MKTYKFNFSKKVNIWFAQFRAIIYITSEFSFYEKKKTETLLTEFWAIIYVTS